MSCQNNEYPLTSSSLSYFPTIVLVDTELEKWYLKGKFHPLELNDAIKIVSEMIQQFEKHKIKVIKVGLHSDIDERNIVAGPYHQSFGELVRGEMLLKRIIDNFEDKTLMISVADISLFKGFNSRAVKADVPWGEGAWVKIVV